MQKLFDAMEVQKAEIRTSTSEGHHFAKSAVADLAKAVVKHQERDSANRDMATVGAIDEVAQQDEQLMSKFGTMLANLRPSATTASASSATLSKADEPDPSPRLFSHEVDQRHSKQPRLWGVPENFAFPDAAKTTLDAAFALWFGGDPSSGVGPFRQLTKDCFGLKAGALRAQGVELAKTYPAYHERILRNQKMLTEWKRVLAPMETCVATLLSDQPSPADIKEAYPIALQILRKEYVSFAFEKPRYAQLSIATWAKFMKPSIIIKNGTPGDRQFLAKRRRAIPQMCEGSQLAITEALERGEVPAKLAKA